MMTKPGETFFKWRDRALRLVKRNAGRAGGAVAPSPGPARARHLADWRDVLSALPDPALLLDPRSVVLDFNTKAAELFPGIERDIPVTAVSRSPELLEGIGLIRDGGVQLTVAIEERVPLERTLMATLSRLPAAGRTSAEMLISIRDLSEASRIEKTRTDFVANASHELRTPLASIIGFIETLQGPAHNDAAARDKFLGVMAVQAQRMKRLVDDLMSLTRVEMHTHIMPREEVDLNALIDDLHLSLEPLAQRERVTLTAATLDRPAIVVGDRDELVQAFQNLIHNAIRHGRSGGNVRVKIEAATAPVGPQRRPSRVLRVSVADDGPGIAPLHLPRLTERFYRVDVAASRRKEGTGLGLAIAKHVINRHRGELEIASELGKGSTFTVSLQEAGSNAARGPEKPSR